MIARSIDYDRLRELLDEISPGPWEVETFEEHPADCPEVTKLHLNSGDMQNIAVAEATNWYYGQADSNFTLMALAPDMARELLRLRDGVKQVADDLGEKAEYAPNIPRQSAYTEAESAINELLNGDTE